MKDVGTEANGGLCDALCVCLSPCGGGCEDDFEVSAFFGAELFAHPDPGLAGVVKEFLSGGFDGGGFVCLHEGSDEADVVGESCCESGSLDDAVGEAKGDGDEHEDDRGDEDRGDGSFAREACATNKELNDRFEEVSEEDGEENGDRDDADGLSEPEEAEDDENDQDIADWLNLPEVQASPIGAFVRVVIGIGRVGHGQQVSGNGVCVRGGERLSRGGELLLRLSLNKLY